MIGFNCGGMSDVEGVWLGQGLMDVQWMFTDLEERVSRYLVDADHSPVT